MLPTAFLMALASVGLSTPAPQAADDAEQILEITRDFVVGFNDNDVERIMRHYSDVYVDVNHPHPVQSFMERASYYKTITSRGDTRVNITPDEIIIDSGMAAVRGQVQLSRKSADGRWRPAQERRYMELLRKAPDGRWRVIWGMEGEIAEEAS